MNVERVQNQIQFDGNFGLRAWSVNLNATILPCRHIYTTEVWMMKFDLHLNINYSAPYHITLAKFDTEYLYGILSHVMYCRITKQQCVQCVQSNNVILP